MDAYSLVSKHPLLAILRNVPLEKTIDYAEAAVRGGAPFFEVALNSPHALEQITMLRNHFGDRCPVSSDPRHAPERPGILRQQRHYAAARCPDPCGRSHLSGIRLQHHEAFPCRQYAPALCQGSEGTF